MFGPLHGTSDRQGLIFGVGVHESAHPPSMRATRHVAGGSLDAGCGSPCPICASYDAFVSGLIPEAPWLPKWWVSTAKARGDLGFVRRACMRRCHLCVLPRCRWLTCQRMWRTNSTVVRAMQVCVASSFSTDVHKSILVDRSYFSAANWAATTRGHTIGDGCL